MAQTVLVGLLLAGCARPAGEVGTPPAPDPPTWASLKECNLTFPDGSPNPCEDKAARIVPTAGKPPSGWICYDHNGGGPRFIEIRTYRNPANGAYALWYKVEVTGTVSGLMQPADANGEPVVGSPMVAWHGGPTEGVVPLDGFPEGNVFFRLYQSSVANATPAVESFREIWSSYHGRPFPVIELTSFDGKRFLLAQIRLDVGTSLELYLPAPVDFVGTDYRLEYRAIQLVSSWVVLNPTPPSRVLDCTKETITPVSGTLGA